MKLNNLKTTFNQDVAEINRVHETELVLNTVINHLRGIYPSWRHSIKTQIELDNLKKEWLAGFIESGIRTDTQIKRGLSAARKSKSPFIPSLGQFIEWCRIPTTSTYINMHNLADVKKLSKEKLRAKLIKECKGYTPPKDDK